MGEERVNIFYLLLSKKGGEYIDIGHVNFNLRKVLFTWFKEVTLQIYC